jgi:hypothetical protein
MHFEILPAAASLRHTFADELTTTASRQHSAAIRDAVVDLVLGALLLTALVALQSRLRRQFGRTLNPLLATATVATAVLLAVGLTMSTQQANRVRSTVSSDMAPYLTIQQARTVAYDATGDAIRYVLAPNFGYDRDFAGNIRALADKNGRGLLADGLAASGPALARTVNADWATVLDDEDRAMKAVVQGDIDTALAVSTGISRGQTAFDFYALDFRLAAAGSTHQDAFTAAMASVRSNASGWAGLPAIVLGAVMALVLAGVRPRLAEYRP